MQNTNSMPYEDDCRWKCTGDIALDAVVTSCEWDVTSSHLQAIIIKAGNWKTM